jgi:hypothetical protein
MKPISIRSLPVWLAATSAAGLVAVSAAESASPFVGHWALTIPGGGAGWLGVTEQRGYYDASVMWGGGSVVPTASVFIEDDTLHVLRLNEVQRRDADGKVVRTQHFPELLQGQIVGNRIDFTLHRPNTNGRGIRRDTFSGVRQPDLPPAPDLKTLRFGPPIELFNGRDLTGWRLTSPHQRNGWRAENGVLLNDPKQEEDKPRISYGNLRTDREFEDFNLKLETMVGPDGNSGIYLRGIYEVQVADSYGRAPNSHSMGGIYSRIAPTANASKRPGEWQTFDITLADRHVTVILNGQTIIDNQPLLGCTGGALWSDPLRPGPIYLQGDHTGVSYRNLVLRPVLK